MASQKKVTLKIEDDEFSLGDKNLTDLYTMRIFKTYLHLLQNTYYFLIGETLPVDNLL
jgi:hypothetical protein